MSATDDGGGDQPDGRCPVCGGEPDCENPACLSRARMEAIRSLSPSEMKQMAGYRRTLRAQGMPRSAAELIAMSFVLRDRPDRTDGDA